jgi:hypothetical protein
MNAGFSIPTSLRLHLLHQFPEFNHFGVLETQRLIQLVVVFWLSLLHAATSRRGRVKLRLNPFVKLNAGDAG